MFPIEQTHSLRNCNYLCSTITIPVGAMHGKNAASSVRSALVRKLDGYARLTEEHKDLIDELVAQDVREFTEKQDILRDGERPDHIHLILDGWAARYKIQDDGSYFIVALLVPGDFCDLHTTVLSRMDHGIMALTDCKVSRVDSDRLDDLITQNNRLTKALWWMTLVDEAVLRQWVINASRRTPMAIAHLLCELHLRLRAVDLVKDRCFDLPLTQVELGECTGASVVHINRSLKKLRDNGLIEPRHDSIYIPDVAALEEAASFDDAYLHLRKGTPRRHE